MTEFTTISTAEIDIALRFVPPEQRLRLGLILLATDLTTESDFARLVPADVAAIHATRVTYVNPTTPENLRRMTPRLEAAAELLVPGAALDGICFSCTAASVVIGDDVVAAAVQRARPGVPVITPIAAARAALKALAVQRIVLLTPYVVETTLPMAAHLAGRGFDVVRSSCLGLEDDREMARLEPACLVEAALRADDPRAEALFISCTALSVLDVVAEIETRLGKPVVTSNQASIWAMSHAAGIASVPEGYGSLFARAANGPAPS
jgi:maleate isomerase